MCIIRRTFEVDGIIAFFWKGAVKYVGLSEDRGKGESLLLQTSVRFSGEKSMVKIGKKISQMRKLKGFTQESLAEKIGVSRQTVFKWESDAMQPTFDKMQTLCSVLGVDVEYFTREEGVIPPVKEEGHPSETENPAKAVAVSQDISVEEAVAVSEETNSADRIKKEKREKRIRRVLLIAMVVGAILAVASISVTVIVALISFSTNVGNLAVNSSRLDKWTFFCVLALSILLCLVEMVLFGMFYKKKRKK